MQLEIVVASQDHIKDKYIKLKLQYEVKILMEVFWASEDKCWMCNSMHDTIL